MTAISGWDSRHGNRNSLVSPSAGIKPEENSLATLYATTSKTDA